MTSSFTCVLVGDDREHRNTIQLQLSKGKLEAIVTGEDIIGNENDLGGEGPDFVRFCFGEEDRVALIQWLAAFKRHEEE